MCHGRLLVEGVTRHDTAGLRTLVTQNTGQAARIDIGDTDHTALLEVVVQG